MAPALDTELHLERASSFAFAALVLPGRSMPCMVVMNAGQFLPFACLLCCKSCDKEH